MGPRYGQISIIYNQKLKIAWVDLVTIHNFSFILDMIFNHGKHDDASHLGATFRLRDQSFLAIMHLPGIKLIAHITRRRKVSSHCVQRTHTQHPTIAFNLKWGLLHSFRPGA